MSGQDENEPEELAGRCRFCGSVLPPSAATCPECGKNGREGYSFAPRRPLWVRVLVYVVLIMLAVGLLAWLVDAIPRWFR